MEERTDHNSRLNNFEKLKNLIIETGEYKEENEPTYSVYHKMDEKNHFILSYDPIPRMISIYYRTDTSNGLYSVLISFFKHGVPSAFAKVKSSEIGEENIYGDFPVNKPFIETENTSKIGKEFSKVVNAEFAVADFLLEKYTGFTFADFCMYYER